MRRLNRCLTVHHLVGPSTIHQGRTLSSVRLCSSRDQTLQFVNSVCAINVGRLVKNQDSAVLGNAGGTYAKIISQQNEWRWYQQWEHAPWSFTYSDTSIVTSSFFSRHCQKMKKDRQVWYLFRDWIWLVLNKSEEMTSKERLEPKAEITCTATIVSDHIRINTAVVTVFYRNAPWYMAPYYDCISPCRLRWNTII